MRLKKYFTFRIWLLLFIILLAVFAISPNPWATGVAIKDVKGVALENGLTVGEIIYYINEIEIKTLEDFKGVMDDLARQPVKLTIETDQKTIETQVDRDINFDVDQNMTVVYSEVIDLETGMKVLKLNDKEVDYDNFYDALNDAVPKNRLTIKTNKQEVAFLIFGKPEITAEKAKKSNIQLGLDLRGGSRVLIEPKAEEGKITDKNINDLISVLHNRLNVYGLADLKIRSAKDWAGNKFILVEIAGATKEEVEELIGKQGVFEAKIGDSVVFEGGKKDIPFVCRGDGSCSGVRPPCGQSGNTWNCKFEFAVHLSPSAARKFAEVTKAIPINSTTDREYLEKTIDFYLDGKEVDKLQIAGDLKGKEATQIAISGPGFGMSQDEAINDALENMNKLQTILITGSLPLQIEIVKSDTISPIFGVTFVKNALLAGLFALFGVALVIYIRYRNLKIIIPMVTTMLCEVFLILGFAALIQWNLDIAAIAGIIAAVGTGVDDQIVITDEVLKGEERYLNWKQKIKRAFFIVFVAYATTVAAMIPLWNAGAGLLRGFAITTIVGVSIGVFLTRPAFASLMEKILE